MPRCIIMFIGTLCLIQSGYLIGFSLVGLAQYFNIIDLLRGKPLLVLTKILYYADPRYVNRVNIGTVLENMSNQAYVLITGTQTPVLVFRTFIYNIIYLSLGIVWFIGSTLIVAQLAMKGRISAGVRVTWLFATILIFVTDLSAFIIYASDYFYTQTLEELISVSGHVMSGAGNNSYNTKWVSWFMVLLLTRGAISIILNFLFFICILTHIGKNEIRTSSATSITRADCRSEDRDIEDPSIPRVYLNPPPVLWGLRRQPPVDRLRPMSGTEGRFSDRTIAAQHGETDKKTTTSINFPENLLSLPQRLENMIAEQQKKLGSAVIDTSGRNVEAAETRASQSLSQVTETSESAVEVHDSKSRRDTAAALQGQMPWSYIPATAHRMRDQLPPDEELPPVPVPDYTIHPSYRKASVHRAGSSISQLQPKKEYKFPKIKVVSAKSGNSVLKGATIRDIHIKQAT